MVSRVRRVDYVYDLSYVACGILKYVESCQPGEIPSYSMYLRAQHEITCAITMTNLQP